MKKTLTLALAVAALSLALSPADAANSIGVGAKYHREHSAFDELPYADGDLSYTAAYEYHSGPSFWQIAVDYAYDVGEGVIVDQVFTPQINLLFQDRYWVGGMGILGTYTEQESGESDWTDPYWQALFGINIPIGRLSLDVTAQYVYETWGSLGDFDFNDIEFGGLLKLEF